MKGTTMKKIVSLKYNVFYGEVQLTAVFDDGTEEFLFGYDPYEYKIESYELIGKTKSEAYKIKQSKDFKMLFKD